MKVKHSVVKILHSVRIHSLRDFLAGLFLIIGAPITIPLFIIFRWDQLSDPVSRRWCQLKNIALEKYDNLLWSSVRSLGRFEISMAKSRRVAQRDRKEPLEQRSHLAKLPVELKQKICRMVYEDMTIHVVSHGSRVRHFVCPEEPALRPEGLLGNARYAQCKCLGSALEPPYVNPPDPTAVKQRREREPRGKHLRVPGLHLTCQEL